MTSNINRYKINLYLTNNYIDCNFYYRFYEKIPRIRLQDTLSTWLIINLAVEQLIFSRFVKMNFTRIRAYRIHSKFMSYTIISYKLFHRSYASIILNSNSVFNYRSWIVFSCEIYRIKFESCCSQLTIAF